MERVVPEATEVEGQTHLVDALHDYLAVNPDGTKLAMLTWRIWAKGLSVRRWEAPGAAGRELPPPPPSRPTDAIPRGRLAQTPVPLAEWWLRSKSPDAELVGAVPCRAGCGSGWGVKVTGWADRRRWWSAWLCLDCRESGWIDRALGAAKAPSPPLATRATHRGNAVLAGSSSLVPWAAVAARFPGGELSAVKM